MRRASVFKGTGETHTQKDKGKNWSDAVICQGVLRIIATTRDERDKEENFPKNFSGNAFLLTTYF